MAKTPAQLLAATKKQLAKSNARLKALEDEQAILNASNQSSTVNTTTLAGITAASRGETGYVPPVDTYATARVGATGKTQAQLDAAANAAAVAKSTGGTVDPNTGYVIPKKKVVVNPDTPPDPTDYVVDTYTDPETGDIYQVYKSGKRLLLSKGTKKADADAAAAKARYDAEQAAIAKQAEDQAEKRDAFATIQDTMRAYGFTDAEMSELSGFIEKQIIDPNIGPNMAILNMRNLGVYKARFSGNEALVKAGKNALSEYDYLQQENAYDEYFKAYGVGNLSTRAQKATLIGNSVSALEVDKRLNLAVRRVQGSDPEILKQLKAYYPTITDKDLVSYFLNPEATRIDLERKVTASEISSAAVGQGFKSGTSLSALDLADYGVDRAAALEGYANVAGVLPEATKLGNIYGETGIKYDQMAGEEEFLKASDAAKRKRTTLASKERASFEGSAGNAPGAYSTGYLKKSSAAGQI
jgi:hypothetical protein